MPAVSVVVPAYNPGPHLRRCLDSIVGQTATDWECIVVDDGGTEDLAWVERIDPRVRRIVQANAGVSIARNRGAAAAVADKIAFCDQDDEWLSDKLADQLLAWSDTTAFGATGFFWHLPDGTVLPPADRPAASLASMLGDNDHICLSSVLVDAAAFRSVGGFSPALRMNQDWLLFLHLLRAYPGCFSFVASPLTRYYTHESNTSRDYRRAFVEAELVYSAFELLEPELSAVIARGRARNRELRSYQALDAARDAKRGGDWRAMATALHRSVRWDPKVLAGQVRDRWRVNP